jgi:hypothetical protein
MMTKAYNALSVFVPNAMPAAAIPVFCINFLQDVGCFSFFILQGFFKV